MATARGKHRWLDARESARIQRLSSRRIAKRPGSDADQLHARFRHQLTRIDNFKFGNEYRYVVRAVSLGTGGAQVESLNSNAVPAQPRDMFAPAPPERPSIAPDPSFGRLAIFFAANKETDIAGYNIYRSTDPNLPKRVGPS